MSFREIVNCSDPRELNLLVATIRQLRGRQRVEVVEHRLRRSDRQNNWYWPAFVQPFADWLSEQQGHTVTTDVAHGILKRSLLVVPVVNRDGELIFGPGGDPLTRVRSTTELNTKEFNEYLDRVGLLLMDLGAIQRLPNPREYHEREETRITRVPPKALPAPR